MDRVAAEVAQKIGVLFQHHDLHARAREQQAQHHSGRSAAGGTAASVNLLTSTTTLTHRSGYPRGWPRRRIARSRTGRVRGRRAHAFAQGYLDAMRKTHLLKSPWEVQS